MTDDVKELPRSGAPPPGMSLDEFAAMFREVDKGRALLKLNDKQVLALDLNQLDDWESVVAAERFKAVGREDLWLEALERVCRSAEHNTMNWLTAQFCGLVSLNEPLLNWTGRWSRVCLPLEHGAGGSATAT